MSSARTSSKEIDDAWASAHMANAAFDRIKKIENYTLGRLLLVPDETFRPLDSDDQLCLRDQYTEAKEDFEQAAGDASKIMFTADSPFRVTHLYLDKTETEEGRPSTDKVRHRTAASFSDMEKYLYSAEYKQHEISRLRNLIGRAATRVVHVGSLSDYNKEPLTEEPHELTLVVASDPPEQGFDVDSFYNVVNMWSTGETSKRGFRVWGLGRACALMSSDYLSKVLPHRPRIEIRSNTARIKPAVKR